MKFIETKIEDAASIMKGLSDQVDKVCLATEEYSINSYMNVE